MLLDPNPLPLHHRRPKLGSLLHSDPPSLHTITLPDDDDCDSSNFSQHRHSTTSVFTNNASPYLISPLNQPSSPYNKSPWLLPSARLINLSGFTNNKDNYGLIGSLVREEGHIYSLAVSGDLLYTGSDSKNIRVWKNLKDLSGFKSSSGLVKAIVICGGKIFTGHQDGKIRIWKVPNKMNNNSNNNHHIRIGTLPSFKDYVKSSMNPKNYVEVRKNRNAVKVKHYDAVSSLSLDPEEGLLYSGSWDKTFKVWRVSDSKCLESINAHNDAVNSVTVGFKGYVFTGSADGTVKMWRRELYLKGKKTRHVLDRVLLEQENAMTALAVNRWSRVVYCGSSEGVVNFWEWDHKKNRGSYCGALRGHKLAVLCLAAAGNLVLSGSADKNVCVWRREESGAHTWLSVLSGHTGPVKCIAIAAVEEKEGEQEEEEEKREVRVSQHHQRWMVYTGSLDKSVKVWRVFDHPQELINETYAPPRDSWGLSFTSPRTIVSCDGSGNQDNRHFQR